MNRSEEFRDLPGNILDCLENTEERFRYKTAVEDDKLTLTYHELMVMARRIGSGILRRTRPGMPVPVLMEKSPVTLAVMLGAVYAGCFYVPVNPSNPAERLRKIFRTPDSPIVVTDEAGQRILREVEEHGEMLTAEELLCEDVDIIRLEQIREAGSETDILYALFTSGSTGTPKAVAVSHGAVIRFIGHFTEIFGISLAPIKPEYIVCFPVFGALIAILAFIILNDEAKKISAVNKAKYRIARGLPEKYHYENYAGNMDDKRKQLAFSLTKFVLAVELIMVIIVLVYCIR